MCVLAFAWRAHPRWRLVVAGNRDELHARPAAALARWNRPDHVLAGRDLQSGGTWLGVSGQGRFAVVTNLRGYDAPEPGRTSRGMLVADVLAGEGRYADPVQAEPGDFNPFNLIFANADEARFLSNRPEPTNILLAPGLYGLSNGGLDEPWPKTLQLKALLLDWLGREAGPDALLDDLRRDVLPDVGLREAAPSDVWLEPPLSPIFIRNPAYGTRCSTVVAIDDQGRGVIVERRYTPAAGIAGETHLGFRWPAWQETRDA
ncbi:NRDE family protein [Sphingosinicella sp. LHD-64]|uniref:NRDE family protein n=1 Tax=Sphingosinicella sp. LHD-64 TaxID=3072139 RepID=UPI00280E4749|nr:NRDE family protein [Sphingosinicella sp. LHD-64]MDQ8755404.1 NRDE family protein [Sphingosinicella sp. LHD-64]